MKKKSNLDILMIMFGFTFFSGSMLIGQKLPSGVEFSDFLVCILIGGTILGIFGGILGYIGAKTGNNWYRFNYEGELFSGNCYFIIWFYIHNLCI